MERERQDAHRIARGLGVELMEIKEDICTDPVFAANEPDRCYYCKRKLLEQVFSVARSRNLEMVFTGANADDTGDYRPGLKATTEVGAHSPLLESGLTKSEIRQLLKMMGSSHWNKPSRACLASRIPYGERITPEKLRRIEESEYILWDWGFPQCRVRGHGALARIEVPSSRLEALFSRREEIAAALRRLGFTYITLDLEGFRSGSLNETLETGEQET